MGAALPMVQTVASLLQSGDRVHRIEAVLSGSLNYIYDTYDGTTTFADVVAEAQRRGYTEPNPMDDLSGTDVMRKIVILAREAGLSVDLEDVENLSTMPEACIQADTTKAVYAGLRANESIFNTQYQKAKTLGNKLKYIAELNNNKISVGIKSIDRSHPFYTLKGTDNMIAIYSDRYSDRPLIIQGAGAGAENTAAGVLSDILNIDFVS